MASLCDQDCFLITTYTVDFKKADFKEFRGKVRVLKRKFKKDERLS